MSGGPEDGVGDWPRGPARPLAPIGEVHVWHADLDDASRSPTLLALLCSADERVRAADMRDARSRDRFVVRRGLHRMLLGGYAVGNHRLELQTTTACVGADVLFGFGRTVGLGLSIVPVPDADPSLVRLPGLTNRERLGLHRLPSGMRAFTACSVIAAKEAIGRARGRGLDARMESVELLPVIEPLAGSGGRFRTEVDGLSWSGMTLHLGPARVACVVHDGGPRAVRAWTMGA